MSAANVGSTVATFIRGAWLNRKYTRLPTSILFSLIALTVILAMLWPGLQAHPTDSVVLLGILLLNALFYPAAREGYYRVTRPMLENGFNPNGFRPLMVLVFYLIKYAMKLTVFTMLWLGSIPLGIVASAWLGARELTGHGWRLEA